MIQFFKKQPIITIDLEQQRQEKLAEIGLCLQEFREHKNLSIATISHSIHIPVSVIKAIETGNLEDLPEPIYTRELLRKYANFLGLKGDDFAEHFNLEEEKFKQKKSRFNLAFLFSHLRFNPLYLFGVYVFLMLISVQNLGNFLKSSPLSNNQIPSLRTNNLDVSSSSNKPSPPKTISVVKNSSPTPKPTEVIVNVTVKDECWVRVTVDGKNQFEGVLNKGDRQKWTGKQQITIRAGNAGGLLVNVNEKQEKTLGKLGQVEEKTFELSSNS